MSDCNYYEAQGINYTGQLKKISKSKNNLQALFEAFTNSLEAIKVLNSKQKSEIKIKINFENNLFDNEFKEQRFYSFEIYDNGIGFTEQEFNRLKNIHDDSKGFSNKGSGRLQLIHFFEVAEYESVFKDNNSSTGFSKRKFKLSKSSSYLEKHAILYFCKSEEAEEKYSYTKLILKNPLDKNDNQSYDNLVPITIKKQLEARYLEYFVSNRETLPLITIKTSLSKEEEKIDLNNIEVCDKNETIDIPYKKLENGKYIKTGKIEVFTIKSFLINENKLDKNNLRLTSKQEIIKNEDITKNIHLDILKPEEKIDNNRFLFLVSSDYIDEKIDDDREQVELYTEDNAKKSLLTDEEIVLIDDIQSEINYKILSMYDEIKKLKDKQTEDVEKLENMFLLNKKTLSKIKININDTDESILKKVYRADVDIIATKDAKIKEQIDKLHSLDLSRKNRNEHTKQLNTQVESIVKSIPLQNKVALTRAVARRKLVLDLFGKILNRQLDIQNDKSRNIDEELLHNLIFQQSSNSANESDLWIINEDFIYYKGTSENTLANIKINRDSILKDNLTDEEMSYKLKQEGDASKKRPDILLFPSENKCILIEFKSPNVNVSEHLNQLNKYASLINNLSNEKYDFSTYYGYLIGENIDVDDIIDNDSDFKFAHSLNYIYRPHKRIVGKFNKNDGALYTEIIKYSTLLERAKIRNEFFIDKLMGNISKNA